MTLGSDHRWPSRRWAHTAALVCLDFLLLALPAAAEGGGHAAEGNETLWQGVNLLIVLGLLFYFARKPVAQFFADRRTRIETDLGSAAELLEQAEARNASIGRRLVDLDAEREEIREETRRRAEEESERILAEARLAAERIRGDAGLAIEQELRRARRELRKEAADLALELAGGLLREKVTDTDRERLVDEFVTRIEASAQE